ncbi:unnamed protein product [Closterium sp. Naga37s-1]|nr:unnamed protein product [Closterium sp. Naga37s-1]
MERQYLTLALLLLAVTISTSAVTTTKHGTLIISNADRSLTVDNYTIHGKTIVDNETKAIVKPKKNPDGSLTVEGKYTWYPNGTIVAPGVTIAVAGKASYVQIAKTKLFGIDGVARDAATNNVIPWIEDDAAKTFTAGDITGWSNGTFLGSNGVVLRTRLRFKPSNGTRGGGSTGAPSPSPAPSPIPSPSPAPSPSTPPASHTPSSPSAPPPPPKPAGSLASPVTVLATAIAVALTSLLFA